MGLENVGKIWTPASLEEYLGSRTPPVWASSITMHHAASPSLADRPTGLTIQHIRNIQSYYDKKLGWKSGPHLFIDEDEIFGMCDFRSKGVHAASFNATSIGIQAKVKNARIITIHREPGNDEGRRGLPAKTNALNPNFVISLHANAFNKTTGGSEALYFHTSAEGKKFAGI